MGLWDDIRYDFKTVFAMDPAAKNKLEVILSYSGLHAIVIHRVNHLLWKTGMPLFPRLFSQIANLAE